MLALGCLVDLAVASATAAYEVPGSIPDQVKGNWIFLLGNSQLQLGVFEMATENIVRKC